MREQQITNLNLSHVWPICPLFVSAVFGRALYRETAWSRKFDCGDMEKTDDSRPVSIGKWQAENRIKHKGICVPENRSRPARRGSPSLLQVIRS